MLTCLCPSKVSRAVVTRQAIQPLKVPVNLHVSLKTNNIIKSKCKCKFQFTDWKTSVSVKVGGQSSPKTIIFQGVCAYWSQTLQFPRIVVHTNSERLNTTVTSPTLEVDFSLLK
eukprot:1483535-Amphidinium_carterae.1